jgi:hypothetical protein
MNLSSFKVLCVATKTLLSDILVQGDEQQKELKMNKLITKVALGVALTGAVALASASPSLAFGGNRYYYEPGANGSTWSYYPGYFDGHEANSNGSYEPRAYGWAPEPRAQHQRRARQYQRND